MKRKSLEASPALLVITAMALGCGYFQTSKDQALVDGIKADSLARVQAALKSGANPNASALGGSSTPLLCAISSNDSDQASRRAIIETLLIAGADPSRRQRDGIDALYMAANMGDADLCKRFCDSGLSPVRPAFKGYSALQIAAVGGDTDCISVMIPHLGPGQIDTPSTGEDHVESALEMACGQGRLEASKLLLDHGANPDFQGNQGLSPLMMATVEGHLEVVELLLSRGAKADLSGQHGATALSLASIHGDLDIMKVLIAHGADVNHQNKSGVTPTMDAAMKGHQDAVDLLLKAGALANIRSNKGLTAADYKSQWESRSSGSLSESGGR